MDIVSSILHLEHRVAVMEKGLDASRRGEPLTDALIERYREEALLDLQRKYPTLQVQKVDMDG